MPALVAGASSRRLCSALRVFHSSSFSPACRSWPRSSATSETAPGSIRAPAGRLSCPCSPGTANRSHVAEDDDDGKYSYRDQGLNEELAGILGQAHHGAQPVEGLRHLIHRRPPTAVSPSPALFSNESNSSSVSSRASVIAAGEASRDLRSSWCVFHCCSSATAWRSWPRSSATSETTRGS